ncbi:MAG: hypothetical protein OEZ68_11775 [Gammaproteobacteria bacterium]|nr:hypothetical protein [Gammaproteobacteria bacterium]MDH5801473.1 hypothetical protein [Gammaproteobacteria bacterium]
MVNFRKLFSSETITSHSMFSNISKDSPYQILAPGTEIIYDVNLIKQLTAEHDSMLATLHKVVNAIDSGDYKKMRKKLKFFLSIFNDHTLKEYSKLYVFLDYIYRGERENHRIVMYFRQEMNEIGKTVRTYANYWVDRGVDHLTIEDFNYQTKYISDLLTTRIEAEEEQLYELYNKAPSRILRSRIWNH